MAWLLGWYFRKKITIDHNLVPVDKNDFPIPLVLASDADLAAHARPDGFDFRVTESDEVSLLNYERELFDSVTGELALFFKGDLTAAVNSVFYLYYGNAGAADGENASAVWDTDFKLVQHLQEQAGVHEDSTVNGNDSDFIRVTQQGTAAGIADGADQFDGLDDLVRIPNAATLNPGTGDFTFEAWLKTTTVPGGGNWDTIAAKSQAAGDFKSYILILDTDGTAIAYIRHSGATNYWLDSGIVVNDGDPHYVVGRRTGNTWYVLVDGQQRNSVAIAAGTNPDHSDPMYIGANRAGDPRYLAATYIDEVRFSKVSRDNDWVETVWNSHTDAGFLTLGAEEGEMPPWYYWAWVVSQVTPVVEAGPIYWSQLSQAMPIMEAHAYYWWLSQTTPVVEAGDIFWQLSQVLPIIEVQPTEGPIVYWAAQAWEDLELEGHYSVVIRDTSGTQLAIVDAYEKLDYTRKLNDQGFVEISAEVSLVDPDYFELDHIIEIWRAPPGRDWTEDFTAFHRYRDFWHDSNDKEWFRSVGPGLENLLKRRDAILPPEGSSFLEVQDEFTDIMRHLVRTQAAELALAARQFPGLSVEVDTHEGAILDLNYRYTNLFEEIATLSELGADFEIAHLGGALFRFLAHFPQRGADRLVGNDEGNAPVIFSLEMANMSLPHIEDDRLKERTIVYVAGDGVGADREIVERSSITGAEGDSPWNRTEGFLEARQETSTGALMALGDAFLSESDQKITFSCGAVPTPACLYRVHWDLGDLVTGYYRDIEYDMKIIEIHVVVDENGEHIDPVFEVFAWRVIPEEEYEEEYEYWA